MKVHNRVPGTMRSTRYWTTEKPDPRVRKGWDNTLLHAGLFGLWLAVSVFYFIWGVRHDAR